MSREYELTRRGYRAADFYEISEFHGHRTMLGHTVIDLLRLAHPTIDFRWYEDDYTICIQSTLKDEKLGWWEDEFEFWCGGRGGRRYTSVELTPEFDALFDHYYERQGIMTSQKSDTMDLSTQ